MNFIDLIFIAIVIIFIIRGFMHGIIVEIATLAGLVLGIYAAFHYSEVLAGYLKNWFSMDPSSAMKLSCVLTFLTVLIIVFLIGKILSKIIDIAMLGIFNKLAGAVFGAVKAVLVSSLLLLFINAYDDQLITSESKTNSFFYPYIEWIAPAIWQQVQPETQEVPEIV